MFVYNTNINRIHVRNEGGTNMNLRIVNRKKFIFNMSLIVGIVFCIIFGSTTLSKSSEKYNTLVVSEGDTLWAIAKEEQQNNPYYENKDIRYIVNDIKAINHLKDGDIAKNQTLNIPTI